MADEITIVEEPPASAETTAEVDAARAAASAEVAQEAAALAIIQAEATTADVAAVAADELQAYQARLEACELSLRDAIRSQEESSARLRSLEETNLSILSRLETSREPPPASPAEEPPSEAREVDPQEAESLEPPAEPSPPERKRAHRWI